MKKLIDYLSAELKIKNKVLLEKDSLLQALLVELLQDKFFQENFVFKGGTCLTKCYFGYYRFSEDLDFTWINQKLFQGKSQKEIRKIVLVEINKIIQLLQNLAKKLHLEFYPHKANTKYIEWGGSSKFSTFKLWYRSEILGQEQFVKIQVNFLELFIYPLVQRTVKPLAEKVPELEFTFLFPEEKALLMRPKVICYSLTEILVEKFRAILTRRSVKARDFIDIFVIAHRAKIDPLKLRKEIIAKTEFMLRYDKYVQNLRDFRVKEFVLGEEEKLLLRPLPPGLPQFLTRMQDFVGELAEELQGQARGEAKRSKE